MKNKIKVPFGRVEATAEEGDELLADLDGTSGD